jgi:hypothetical protein
MHVKTWLYGWNLWIFKKLKIRFFEALSIITEAFILEKKHTKLGKNDKIPRALNISTIAMHLATKVCYLKSR